MKTIENLGLATIMALTFCICLCATYNFVIELDSNSSVTTHKTVTIDETAISNDKYNGLGFCSCDQSLGELAEGMPLKSSPLDRESARTISDYLRLVIPRAIDTIVKGDVYLITDHTWVKYLSYMNGTCIGNHSQDAHDVGTCAIYPGGKLRVLSIDGSSVIVMYESRGGISPNGASCPCGELEIEVSKLKEFDATVESLLEGTK